MHESPDLIRKVPEQVVIQKVQMKLVGCRVGAIEIEKSNGILFRVLEARILT